MDQQHAGSAPVQVERRLGSRVLAADDDDPPAVVRVRLTVIVRDVRQILARNADEIRHVVRPGRHDDGRGLVQVLGSVVAPGPNRELA